MFYLLKLWFLKAPIYWHKGSARSKRRAIGFILNTTFSAPAFFFHEFCHILVLTILRARWETKRFYFLRFNKKLTILRGWGWSISIDAETPWWKCFFISIAPLIGWSILISLTINSINLSNLFLLFYFIWNYNAFLLSDEDINTAAKALYFMTNKEARKAHEALVLNALKNKEK